MAIVSDSTQAPREKMLARWLPPWWTGYLLSLYFPLATLAFLLTGPHDWWAAALWTLPMWLLVAADLISPAEFRIPPTTSPRWFFDGILYLLSVLQVANVLALGAMVADLSWSSGAAIADSVATLGAVHLMIGPNFVCGAICPAHELIHRRRRWQRRLGRLLLGSVCYDHFAVAHKHFHHAKLGSRDDPSTAFPDEDFESFFRRSASEQIRLAWQSDRFAVVIGCGLEVAWLLAYMGLFGPLAVAVLLSQAYGAVRHLEAVNYFQHYGLTETSGSAPITAWRCHSRVSLFIFVGLTRHADHHRHPGITYPYLRPFRDGPNLPFGYLGTAVMVQRRNSRFRAWAKREAERFAAARLAE